MEFLSDDFKKHYLITSMNYDSPTLELILNMKYAFNKTYHEGVTFEEFDLNNKFDQKHITNCLTFFCFGLDLLAPKVYESLLNYYVKKYDKTPRTAKNHAIESDFTGIYVSPEMSFGDFIMYFNSDLEVEHGVGILIKQFKPVMVGFGSIRFCDFD